MKKDFRMIIKIGIIYFELKYFDLKIQLYRDFIIKKYFLVQNK